MNGRTASPCRIVLLGPPASGKGTQGRRLAQALELDYLSTGALLREHIEGGSELGRHAAPILERGGYLPDDLMCRTLAEWLERHPEGWVIDGFPRSIPQARFLDEWLVGHAAGLDAAVSLEVPFDELLRRIHNRVECSECRWSGQRDQTVGGRCPVCHAEVGARADDHVGGFTSRYHEFERLTLPVIDYYRTLGLLIPCDATAPQDEVAEKMIQMVCMRKHI